MMIFLMRGGK